MRRPSKSLLAALAACAIAACAGAGSGDSLQRDSVFINSMVELRRIGTDSSLDSAARDSAREAVLRSHGITATRLEEMARELARDPERALEVWREIDQIAAGERAKRGGSGAPTGP